MLRVFTMHIVGRWPVFRDARFISVGRYMVIGWWDY
jgi:hypothetical protein